MQLSRRYLNLTEKLSEFVLEMNEELEFALDSLRSFLERDVDGYTSISGDALAYAVQSRVEEIWSCLSDIDKSRNANLIAFIKKFIRRLEKDSGYEADIDFPEVDLESEVQAEDLCKEAN